MDTADILSETKKYYLKTHSLAHNFSVALDVGATTIGRDHCDIDIKHSSLSCKHCSLVLTDDGVLSLVDHGSGNGTHVAGHKLKEERPVILEANDVILLGQMVVEILYSEPDEIENVLAEAEEETKVELDGPTRPAMRGPVIQTPGADIRKISDDDQKVAGKISEDGGMPMAGGFLRFMAILSDLSLSFAIYSYLMQDSQAQTFLADGVKGINQILDPFLLWPIAQTIHASIQVYLPFILTYIAFRLLGTLIFGVSFSQFFIGIRTDQNALISRVLGLVREMIGFVTTPIVILDIPPLLKWKSFKEVVTLSKLRRTTVLSTMLGVVVFFPISITLGVLSPLLQDFSSLEQFEYGIPISHLTVKKKDKNSEVESTTEVKRLYSSRFQAKFLEEKGVVFVPSFDIIHKEKRKIIVPNMTYYRETDGQIEKISLFKTFSLFNLLEVGEKFDPNFPISFPTVWEAISSNKGGYNPLRQGKEKKLELKRKTIENEIAELIVVSMRLGIVNIIPHIENNGPFVMGMISLRKELLSLIDMHNISSLEIENVSGITFLKAINDSDPKRWIARIIPLAVHPGMIFEYAVEKKGGDKILGFKKSLRDFLQNTEWGFYDNNERSFPDLLTDENFDPYLITDFFISKSLFDSQYEVMDEQVFGYFYHLAGRSISDNNIGLQKYILTILNRYKVVLKKVIRKNQLRQQLLDKIEELSLALKNLDRDYFATALNPAKEEGKTALESEEPTLKEIKEITPIQAEMNPVKIETKRVEGSKK